MEPWRGLPMAIAFLASASVLSLLSTLGSGARTASVERLLKRRLNTGGTSLAAGNAFGQSGAEAFLRHFVAGNREPILASLLGAVSGAAAGGFGLSAVGLGLGFAAGGRLQYNRAAKATAEFGRQLEQAILLLAAALSANQTLLQGLRAVGDGITDPVGKLFRSILEEHSAGRPLPDCLAAAATKANHRELSYLVQALEVQRHTGGDLVGVLSHTAAAVRERRLLRGEMESKVAEAKLTADVLTLSTLGLAAYFIVLHPETLTPLYQTPTGRLAVAYAALSWIMGTWIMGRLLRLQDLEDAG